MNMVMVIKIQGDAEWLSTELVLSATHIALEFSEHRTKFHPYQVEACDGVQGPYVLEVLEGWIVGA